MARNWWAPRIALDGSGHFEAELAVELGDVGSPSGATGHRGRAGRSKPALQHPPGWHVRDGCEDAEFLIPGRLDQNHGMDPQGPSLAPHQREAPAKLREVLVICTRDGESHHQIMQSVPSRLQSRSSAIPRSVPEHPAACRRRYLRLRSGDLASASLSQRPVLG